ncbi:hypothetical protein LWC34_49830 [Kibdelosporangium philippinense]|uniref:Fe/B12 periplasmic-binding domain-containing protein n=1 Tax=Kibdelosporangium philippinense TaxID=211113 RepID=A0ABS8ZSZ6_9PSEU|nr:hypothetical protein [Kibdelosporangium philippinense]MCE7010853.1 hypothetical protein [Kibdelosporangium philippinense]
MAATLVEPLVADVNRRWFIGVAGGTALGLAGCGTGESRPDSAPAPGFPVQVDGKFGPTVLNGPPQRVVALGLGPDASALLALGVVPVAMAADSTLPGGIPPWVRDALQGRQVELLLSLGYGLDHLVNQIAVALPAE